jgi:hypothetical protein
MKKAKTNGIVADASSAVPKWCGRCATAIERNEFCPECTEFFEALAGGMWNSQQIPTQLRKVGRERVA